MINRYTQPTRYQGNFYTPPLDLLKETLESAQQAYNQNYAVASQIKNKYVNALEKDRARANELQQGWEGRIDDIVSKYSGDYSRATKDLNSLLSDMQREYNPGGAAHAIEYNYKTWTDNWKDVQEGVSKGNYTATQAISLQKNFMDSYQGIGEKDPITGAYNTVSATPLNKYVDANELVKDVVAKVPKKKTKVAVPYNDGQGHISISEREVEYVDPRELESAVSQTLANNDAWVSYVTQLANLQGQDPTQALVDAIDSVSANVLPLYSGVMSDLNSLKIQNDQTYIARLNHQYALQRQRENNDAADRRVMLKHALDNGLGGPEKDELARLGTRTSANTFKPVNKKDGVYSTTSGFLGQKTVSTNVDYILSHSNDFSGNVNIDLLKAAKESASKRNQGKTRDVNGLTWDIYNEMVDREHVGDAIYMRRFSTSKEMDEQAQRLLPSLLGGGVDIWEMDTNTGVVTSLKDNASAREKAYKNLWNTTENKPSQPALGMTSVQTGVPFGTVFPKKDGGYYIVGEMHEDIRNMNNDLFEKAFGFINSPVTTGGIFQVDYEGTPLSLYGKKDYIVSDEGFIDPQFRYYSATDNELVTIGQTPEGKPIPMTPANMEDILFPKEYRKLFKPYTASKSDLTRFNEYTGQ